MLCGNCGCGNNGSKNGAMKSGKTLISSKINLLSSTLFLRGVEELVKMPYNYVMLQTSCFSHINCLIYFSAVLEMLVKTPYNSDKLQSHELPK